MRIHYSTFPFHTFVRQGKTETYLEESIECEESGVEF